VYLGWSDLGVLRFLRDSGINNLCGFNGVIGSTPTPGTNFVQNKLVSSPFLSQLEQLVAIAKLAPIASH
jgi:hypothetical protein